MTSTIKKSLMLAVAVVAVSAMAVPSMASAANWGTPGTNHTLKANSVGMSFNVQGSIYQLGCLNVSFYTHVRSPASSTLDITSAASFTCTSSTHEWSGCTITATPATALPWTASGASTTNVTLNSLNYNLLFSGSSCSWKGATINMQGTLTGGVWNNTVGSRGLTYNADIGLALTGPFGWGTNLTYTTGTFTDPFNTLTLS